MSKMIWECIPEQREYVFHARIAVSGCNSAEEALRILNDALLERIDAHTLAAQRQARVISVSEVRAPIHPDTGC